MKKSLKITALVLIITIMTSINALAANPVSAPEEFIQNKDTLFSDEGKITLTAGTDSSSVNMSWISYSEAESFRFGKAEDLSDAKSVKVKTVQTPVLIYFVNRVALTGLEAGAYYYTYTFNGKEQPISSFEIKAADEFSVMFCSDPQLGRSGDDSEKAILDDAYGWQRTLDKASAFEPSLILCGGDQVNTAMNEKEYNAFLAPDILRSIPVAATVGNHEMYTQFYSYHFFNPNINENEAFSFGGNDYYFTYGNALFIVLNTNNFIRGDHEAIFAKAVSEYPDTQWRVVMTHQSVYSIDADQYDNKLNNKTLPSLFEEYGVDLVLSGHDHIHARTTVNGITYFEAGNASGCNFSRVSEEVIPDYIEYYNFMDEATYSIIDFTADSLTVTTYGTDTDTVYDSFTVTVDSAKTVPDYKESFIYAFLRDFMEFIMSFVKNIIHVIK